MRAGGPCGSKMYGRIVGAVGGATLEAVATDPGAQISAAANALADATQLNATNKQSARHARIDFICKVNTVGVYTLDVGTTNIFTTKKLFLACACSLREAQKIVHAIQTLARKKMPVKGIEPSRPARGNGF